MKTQTEMDEREKDIQKVCRGVMDTSIRNTGDYGMGGECPFCYAGCRWDDGLYSFKHEPDCIYLIAKDLLT